MQKVVSSCNSNNLRIVTFASCLFLIVPLDYRVHPHAQGHKPSYHSTSCIEYGIGAVVSPYGIYGSMIFNEKPSMSSKVLATIRRDTIWFNESKTPYPCFGRTLVISHNDEFGLPILEFSPDSLWVKVSLDCRKKENPSTGWISINSRLHLKLWPDFFSEEGVAIYFMKDEWIQFYSVADSTKSISYKLVYDRKSPDYSMRVRKVLGRWMEVDLETPSTFMIPPEEQKDIQKIRVWIQFLDENDRPKVWYYWD